MANGILVTNFDYGKLFVYNNRYDTRTYTNSTGSSVTLAAGTVMGTVQASGKVLPMKSDATDGSQQPIGVLAADYTIADGASVDLSICVGGDVVESRVVLAKTGDTMSTSVGVATTGGGIIRDLIQRNSAIKLVGSNENTYYDDPV